MQTLMDVVSRIKIAAQHPLDVLPDQLLDDFSSPPMVVFVIADTRGRDAPDVAVAAIFSPAGFIGLYRRTSANLCFETGENRLRILSDPMQQFHQLPQADL